MVAQPSYECPLPAHYKKSQVGELFVPDYAALFERAPKFRKRHGLSLAGSRKTRVGLLGIDYLTTFCGRNRELTLYPRAIRDVRRATEFLYRNIGVIDDVILTADCHLSGSITQPIFWLDKKGRHPKPFTDIRAGEVGSKWFVNRQMADSLGKPYKWLVEHAAYVVSTLGRLGFPLTVWPFHAQSGCIDQCFVPSFSEAVKFHYYVRQGRERVLYKGRSPFIEEYSSFNVLLERSFDGTALGSPDVELLNAIVNYDVLIVCGEALSHCVPASISGIIAWMRQRSMEARIPRIYLLQDCCSPVTKFEKRAEEAVRELQSDGVQVVSSTVPMIQWPGINQRIFAAAA